MVSAFEAAEGDAGVGSGLGHGVCIGGIGLVPLFAFEREGADLTPVAEGYVVNEVAFGVVAGAEAFASQSDEGEEAGHTFPVDGHEGRVVAEDVVELVRHGGNGVLCRKFGMGSSEEGTGWVAEIWLSGLE